MKATAAASLATSKTTKFIKMGISLFRKTFDSSKCKTAAKMAVARIKLLRNKREVIVKQMRRDIALLIQSGQDATARIRVEHVLREQNILAANEIVELFCELIVSRLSIIAKQRACPADLKEGIASLIFAAPRCSEIPELAVIRDVFEKKYGKDFVSAATDLRPSCGVNRLLVDNLSVRNPSGEVKLKIMKEIAKEYQVEWDTTESEKELLKPPEELLDGPRNFVSATTFPVKSTSDPSSEMKNAATRSSNPQEMSGLQYHDPASAAATRSSNPQEMSGLQYHDPASAAEAAAASAEQAIAAAEAASVLANKNTTHLQSSSYHNNPSITSACPGFGVPSSNSARASMPIKSSWDSSYQSEVSERNQETQSCYRSHHLSNEEWRPKHISNNGIHRRESYNANSEQPGNKFDSGCYEARSPTHQLSNEELRPMHMTNNISRRRHSYNANTGQSYCYDARGPSDIAEKKVYWRKSHNVNTADSHVKFDSDYYEQTDQDHTDGRRDDVCRRYNYNANGPYSDVKFDESDYDENEGRNCMRAGNNWRRHSYNAPSVRSGIKFDESDCEEDSDMEDAPRNDLPPARAPPPVPSLNEKQNSLPRVHPRLPDYDELAACFEALRYQKQ